MDLEQIVAECVRVSQPPSWRSVSGEASKPLHSDAAPTPVPTPAAPPTEQPMSTEEHHAVATEAPLQGGQQEPRQPGLDAAPVAGEANEEVVSSMGHGVATKLRWAEEALHNRKQASLDPSTPRLLVLVFVSLR